MMSRRLRRGVRTAMACLCAGCLAWGAAGELAPASESCIGRREEIAEVGAISMPAGGDRININTAGSEELQRLKGIGPALAEAIILEREQNGPFRYPEELLTVRGIGSKTVERLRDLICFE